MCLGKRCAPFEDDGVPVFGFLEAFEYPGDPIIFLDMSRWNPEMVRRCLNELQVCVGRLVQVHRMFQVRDSGQSSESMPRSKRVVGLSEALSADNTSSPQRVSNIPSRATVLGL